jgi:hypothetical protein
MFEGFSLAYVDVPAGTVGCALWRLRLAVLLPHGHPERTRLALGPPALFGRSKRRITAKSSCANGLIQISKNSRGTFAMQPFQKNMPHSSATAPDADRAILGNWGWLGLLGVIGLVGLKNARH